MSPLTKKSAPNLKFLLDENVDVRLASYLKKRGFSVMICPKGITNGNVMSLARRKSCILLTNDKDFANSDMYKPSQFAGIVVFRIHPPKLKNLTTALEWLLVEISPDEFTGKLFVVGEGGIEISR